jgi:GT2 family glycosyltransferase
MQSKGIIVSVIVVNFNGMPYIESCLRSILKQDFAHFEVILVDNKSSDGSLEFVRRMFPDLLIVANEENLGYTGGINSGIAQAKGKYLAPLNVDTEVEKNWLSAMVEFMDANPEVGAVTPKSLLYRNRDKVGVEGLNIHITGLGFVRGLNKQNRNLLQEPFLVAGVSGCSYLIRREIVEKMGGLNESNFMYYDDVDLSWMINLMGYKIYCVPQSVVYHEYKLKMTPQKIFWLEHGRENAILSYLKPFTFIVLTPALAFTEALITGYCLIRGPRYIEAKLRAWFSVLRTARGVMRRRRRIQRLRKLSDFQLLRRFKLNYEWGQVLHILK